MELELLLWGDDTIRLTYWDSLHGNDRSFILGVDGRAYEEDVDDGEPYAVDFVAELRKLATAGQELP